MPNPIFSDEPVVEDRPRPDEERRGTSEQEPLLGHKDAGQQGPSILSDPDLEFMLPEETTSTFKLILTELAVLSKGAIPVILAYALQSSLQTGSVLIVGRASSEDLSTASFSYNFATSTGYLVAMGGSTALDTLASSSFTGSTDKHDMGILLQRTFLVLTLFYIPIAVLWVFSRPVFLLLGQTDRIATDSAKFLTNLIPGGLGCIYFETMKKYLQAQGIMRPGTYVLAITSPISALLNYLFVYVAGWGIFAAPFATGIGYWLSFLGLVLYTKFVAGSDGWGGWSKRCFDNLGTFSKLALLGIIQVGSEWWAFEVVAIAAGWLGEVPLAAQSVIMTADELMNTIPFGLGVAASARVGNMLGARNAKGARRAANTSAWFSIFCGVIILAVLMGTRNVFGKIFTNDERVIRLVSDVMPFVALFQIADGLSGTCGGLLRGMGRQNLGAAVNLVSYYCLALPVGIHMALHSVGLAGLWIGSCIGLYLAGLGQWAVVIFSDWNREVDRAFERLDDGSGS